MIRRLDPAADRQLPQASRTTVCTAEANTPARTLYERCVSALKRTWTTAGGLKLVELERVGTP